MQKYDFAIVPDDRNNNVLVGGVTSRAEYAVVCSKPEWGNESGKFIFPLHAYKPKPLNLNFLLNHADLGPCNSNT